MSNLRYFIIYLFLAIALVFGAYLGSVFWNGIRNDQWPIKNSAESVNSEVKSSWATNKIENSLEKAFVIRSHAYIPINIYGQAEDYYQVIIGLMNRFEDRYKVRIVDYKFATGLNDDREKIFRGIWIIHEATKK